jgi:plastocyanin
MLSSLLYSLLLAAAPQITASDDFFTPTAVTVALNGTVDFDYPVGGESHNVHFARDGAECAQTAGAKVGAVSGRAVPETAESAGWSAACRFPQAGIYRFSCDDHAEMTGQVTVLNADGTPPVEATPTPAPTPPSATPVPTPTPAPTPATTPATATLAAVQKGTRITATLTGGSARSTVTLEALAKRSDLRAKGKAKLLRVGKATKTVAAGATVKASVPLNAAAKRALKRRKKLKLTVNIAIDGARMTKTVTVRVK